jgi:hypothetical protein
MPKSFEESLDECLTVLRREFIIFGSDEPTFTKLQVQSVAILVRGGVTARDFAFAIESDDLEFLSDKDRWDNIIFEALIRRSDINCEIAEAQK